MKKIFFLTAIVLTTVLLSGCLDVLHYVGRDGQGRPMALVKLTFEKALFEMAASMGGEEMPTTDEEFAEEFDISEEEITGDLPEGIEVEYSTVNTSMDFGFQLILRGSSYAPPDTELPWLPLTKPDGSLVIPLAEQDSDDSGEGSGGDESEAFLASAKYRLIVARNICPPNPRFSLRGLPADRTVEPEVMELPEVYVVEFPLVLWLNSTGTMSVVAE